MEDTSQEVVSDKPKRGRPRKVVEETAIVPVTEPSEPVKIKRTRKKPDPETAVQNDVAFTSKKGEVSFKAMRAPPKPKLERSEPTRYESNLRPYAQLHDRYSPYGHFMIA